MTCVECDSDDWRSTHTGPIIGQVDTRDLAS